MKPNLKAFGEIWGLFRERHPEDANVEKKTKNLSWRPPAPDSLW